MKNRCILHGHVFVMLGKHQPVQPEKLRRGLKFWIKKSEMSRVVRKPAFCICENKDADQLRGNCEADQRLCFGYIDSTIPLVPKYEISSL